MSTPTTPTEQDVAVREAIERAFLIELRAWSARLHDLTELNGSLFDAEVIPLGPKLDAGDTPHLLVSVLYEPASQTASSTQRIDGFALQGLIDCDLRSVDLRQLCGQAIFGTTPIVGVDTRGLANHVRCNAAGEAACEKIVRQAAALRLFPDQAAEFGAKAQRRD